MSEEIFVIKKNGERELYSDAKVLKSIERVGIKKELQDQVLQEVHEHLKPNITTKEIFAIIRERLGKTDKRAQLRFNLKDAIFDLGPTGFPFEKYLEKIFEDLGYNATTDVIMQGECVKHEIDVLLEKDGKRSIVEAKFHNTPGTKTDVQTALYTYARYLDVKEKNNIDEVWLVTNTKLTEDAIVYSQCKGIRAVGWAYPAEGNLQDVVEKPEHYPVTILKDLTREERERLLLNNIVLTCDLLDVPHQDLTGKFQLDSARLQNALDDAQIICAQEKKA